MINGERIYLGIEEPIRRVVAQQSGVPNPTGRWDYDRVVTDEPAGKLTLVIRASNAGKVQTGDFVARPDANCCCP